MGLWKWLKDNGVAIMAIAAVVSMLTLTGFSPNIPKYYGSLSPEGKIIFVLIFNTLLTVVLFFIAIKKNKITLPNKKSSRKQ